MVVPAWEFRYGNFMVHVIAIVAIIVINLRIRELLYSRRLQFGKKKNSLILDRRGRFSDFYIGTTRLPMESK